MPRVVVIYDSRAGLTEKMAKAVVEGIKKVRGIEVELLKLGTAFSISKLDLADALIFGSPTIYGSTTPEMNTFIEALKEHKKSKRLKLSGKIGGVFGSYGYNGGWVIEKLSMDMKALGIEIVSPPISVADKMGGMGIRIDEKSLQKCRELGHNIALRFAVTK